jgi:hypothetical protein
MHLNRFVYLFFNEIIVPTASVIGGLWILIVMVEILNDLYKFISNIY